MENVCIRGSLCSEKSIDEKNLKLISYKFILNDNACKIFVYEQ